MYDFGNNSAVLELTDNRFLVTRISEKLPSRQLALDEVEAQIREELTAIARDAQRQAILTGVKERIASGETMEDIANQDSYEWRVEIGARRSGGLLPPEVARLAFSMKLLSGPTIDMVDLPGGDLAVVELARLTPGQVDNLDPGEADRLVAQLGEVQGQLSLVEYRLALRQNADVVVR